MTKGFIFIKDMTLEQFREYGHLRAADGNWGINMAMCCCDFFKQLPKKKRFERKKKYKARCEKFWRENINSVWNIEDYPKMLINIETGEVLINGN